MNPKIAPVICFFKDDHYLYSEDYQLLACPEHTDIESFLSEIEKKFSIEVKVIQINFYAFHKNIFKYHKEYYKSAKAHVFVLNNYKTVRLEDLKLFHKVEKKYLDGLKFRPSITKKNFIDKVHFIQKEIKSGRIYQVNLTSSLQAEHSTVGFNLFLELLPKFTGNYQAFLPLQDYNILCFSPELFLEKKNDTLRTRPIKGSLHPNRPVEKDLLKNKKEEAELSMIVDLLRNDLNSLSDNKEDGTAQITQHRTLMNLGYIQHTYSEILIKTKKSLSKILAKVSPGGSISGCPKLESLKLISEVEDYDRGFYTGTIGWWQKEDFCLNLAIRSFSETEKSLFYFAGCGIVYDSVAEEEWNEFLTKAGHLNVITN